MGVGEIADVQEALFYSETWSALLLCCALLRCHSVQGLYGTHLAGIVICPSIHLPVK